MVYWQGLRYAWYHIPAGNTLNDAGERDPYPQAFVILKGAGRLRLDNDTVELAINHTYYIPKGSVHMVDAATDMELLWIAWDTPW